MLGEHSRLCQRQAHRRGLPVPRPAAFVRRTVLPAVLLVAVFAAGCCLPKRGLSLVQASDSASQDREPESGKALPSSYANALTQAWREIDALQAAVNKKGIVLDYGSRAAKVVSKAKKTAASAGNAPSQRLEQVLDGPLHAMFKKQLQTLRTGLMDRYEADMLKRPNPLEAAWSAEKSFKDIAGKLLRPGSSWHFQSELEDLLAWLNDSYQSDSQLVEEQGKQGQGKQITVQVIRALQDQAATVQRTADAHGAFPWKINWQWIDMRSFFGFRGSYDKGRSVLELLLLPSNDPQKKKKYWWHRLGQMNMAMVFDALQ
mmetsp:Transcript_56615/g.134869  ORF Transcript_56615/g.134869 Transcript_56615/m.134869 type:complete len:316 (+) Transcript_56615:110-1057(+)